jgi:hypothetical protein
MHTSRLSAYHMSLVLFQTILSVSIGCKRSTIIAHAWVGCTLATTSGQKKCLASDNKTNDSFSPPSRPIRDKSSAVMIWACSMRGLHCDTFTFTSSVSMSPVIIRSNMSSTTLFARSPMQCIFFSCPGSEATLWRLFTTHDLPPIKPEAVYETL